MNGLAVMYNQSGRTTKVSFSSTMQFPKFNAFMRGCVTIHRGLVAIKEASKDAAAFEILQDRELPLLWNNTNFDSLYEVQRMGMAILAFRTGLRGDTLRKLDIDMYALIVEGGEKYLQPVVGTMKNLAASLDRVEKALFKQRVAQCEDHRFCAIWWFQKLASMSPLKTKGPLFHFLNPLSNSVQEGKRAGYGVCRGTANWATWEAPPAPEGTAVNRDFSNVPQPFKRMRRPRYPPRHVPSKCSREIFVWRPLRGGARIQCKVCNAPYHESCFYATSSTSTMNVDDGVGPCCRE